MSTLQQLLGPAPGGRVRAAITRHECAGGPGHLRARDRRRAAPRRTPRWSQANGAADVARWTASTDSKAAGETMPVFDSIDFRALGIVGQPNIDWQNRPTFQQVVQFPRHRKR